MRSTRELAALSELREKPAGTIRITAHEHAVRAVLWPALEKLLPDYPDIKVEIVIDYGLTDIVAERYDAGVRSGEMVAKDMIAVRIGPDMRMAVVGAPSYFAKRPKAEDAAGPDRPQPASICACRPMAASMPGSSRRAGASCGCGSRGSSCSTTPPRCSTPHWPGSAWPTCPRTRCRRTSPTGGSIRVLADWCPPFPGYHLYYPSRRQPTPAFALLVDALRYRG